MKTYAAFMARLDRAIQEHKAQHYDAMLDALAKPGHNNIVSIEARPALAHKSGWIADD